MNVFYEEVEMNSNESVIIDIGDIKRMCAMMEERIKDNKELLEALLQLLEKKKGRK